MATTGTTPPGTATGPLVRGATATIFVSDMDRAVAFYATTLGLAIQHRAGDHFCMLDAGGGTGIGLHPPSKNAAAPGTRGAIEVGLNVTRPIGEVVATLESRGVDFEPHGADGGPVVDDGAVKLAFFGDPDGNRLYLCEVQR